MKNLLYSGLKNPQKITPFLIDKILYHYIESQYSNMVHDSSELKSIAHNFWKLPDNTEGLNASLAERIGPGKDNVELRKTQNFEFTEPFVCEINDVTLSGKYAAGKTSKNKYIEDMLIKHIRRDEYRGELKEQIKSEWNFFRKITQSRSVSHLDTAAVIHRPKKRPNFYHWIIDCILNLRGIDFYEQETGDDVTLIISEHTPNFARDAIDLLGFRDHSIIEWEENKLYIDTLVVPSLPEPTPGNLEWIRSNIECSTNTFDSDKEWIYISRQNTSRGRKVANFDEILPVLNNFGVDIIHCEKYSLEEQVELFRCVDGVISPHGAGLTGMIWTDSLSIIELFNDIAVMPFYVLAYVLEHEYTYLMGEAVTEQDYRHPRDRDLIINPSNFKKLLDREL